MAVAGPLLVISMRGALMAVVTVWLLQPDTQAGSPPPVTVAVLSALAPAAAVAVTLITCTAVLLGAVLERPALIVQITVWLPIGLRWQPADMLLIVNPVGTTSVTVALAAVATAPVLVTVSM